MQRTPAAPTAAPPKHDVQVLRVMYEIQDTADPGADVLFGSLSCVSRAKIDPFPTGVGQGYLSSSVDLNCTAAGEQDFVQAYMEITYLDVYKEFAGTEDHRYGKVFCVEVVCSSLHSPHATQGGGNLNIPCGGLETNAILNPRNHDWENQLACEGDWYAGSRTYITPFLGAKAGGHELRIVDYEPKSSCVIEMLSGGDQWHGIYTVKCYFSAEVGWPSV